MTFLRVSHDEGRIESANAALLQLLGYEAHELIGQNISIIMPQPYRDNHPSYLAKYLVTGKRVIIGSGRDVPAVRKDGTLIDIHVSVSEMRIGTSRKYTGMIRDISERKRMEETIRESEERFRQLAESIDAVFWLTTSDKSEVLYVSPAFDRIWECSREILRTNPRFWLEHIHPDDQKRVSVATACQAYLPYDEEYRIITASGRERWIRDRSFAIKNEAGQTYRVAGIAQDITSAKELEAQLRASEQRHRALVEMSPHAIFVNYNSNIVFANQACVKLFGAFDKSQLLGKAMMDFIHADSRVITQERFARLQSTNGSWPSTEEHFVALDGSVIAVEVAATGIKFEGKPAIQVILTDIRARKQLERALVASNLQLETILASATRVSIIAINTEGMITTFNAGATHMLGYTSDEMIGQPMLTALHLPEELAKHTRDMSELNASPIDQLEALTQQARLGGFDEQEWTYRKKDGRCLTVLVTVTALKNTDGVVSGFLATGKDITQRKATENELLQYRNHLEDLVESRTAELCIAKEAAEAASRAKSTFLANMSHELRTPMNGILGMTDLVLRHTDDPKAREQLGKVIQSSHHLLAVINNILDISKIEADRLALEAVSFRFSEVLESVVSLLGHKAEEKQLKLEIEVAPEVSSLTLLGDPFRLRQILLNLTGNALKFTDHGSITVRCGLLQDSPDGVLLRIDVVDTGIGITAGQQGHLFAAFEQADGTMTRKYGGTGLGLAISKRFVEMMGGEIGVISTAGQGSTFWFTVRLGKSGGAVAAIPALVRQSADERLLNEYAGTRILLAEDEPINQEVSRCLLEDIGLVVDLAEDGLQALELAKHNTYALILMDMQMPRMNGVDATRAIRALPEYAHTPILAMTANAFDEDRQICHDAGMNDHLAKPVDPDTLFETLLKWLSWGEATGRPPGSQ